MWNFKSFLDEERAQASIEFVLVTGGVIVAAITIFSLQGTISSLANVSTNWAENQRNASISKITR
jgi:uncharacterized protein (UPF0333 family)